MNSNRYEEIRQPLEALKAENEKLQAEIEVWKMSFDQAASGHATYAEQAEKLRQALEVLEAENDLLRKALKDADNELDWLDETIDPRDHSYWGMRRKMKAALAKENINEERSLRRVRLANQR